MTIAPATIYKMLKAHVDERGTDYLGKLSRDIAALFPASDDWQPIETAPKDGSWILAGGCRFDAPIMVLQWGLGPFNVQTGKYDMAWVHGLSVDYRPTHWKPLPTPPETQP